MMFVTKVVITFDVYLNFGLDVTILSGVCFNNLQERKKHLCKSDMVYNSWGSIIFYLLTLRNERK